MSTATGNVKISELHELSSIGEGTKLRIPVSKDKSSTSTPDWESFSVNGDVLSQFMETSLGLNDLGAENPGLRGQVKNLQTQTGDLETKTGNLEKHLGKYKKDVVTKKSLREDDNNAYYSTAGEGGPIVLNGYSISQPVDLKQGNLYLLNVGTTTDSPSDISFVTKVHEHTYADSTGATHSEITYEPQPTHYYTSANGAPSSGYLVFFAPEDMKVIISGPSTSFTNGLEVVQYGAFIEIADQLLSINGELMKVIVEAITKNRKDIESLYEKTKSLGDIHVTSIDSDEFPSVQGEPMVVVADRAPGSATDTHGADVPNRIGQIWVNSKDGVAYIAVALELPGWKQITNG